MTPFDEAVLPHRLVDHLRSDGVSRLNVTV
jgi:hypothetical protein